MKHLHIISMIVLLLPSLSMGRELRGHGALAMEGEDPGLLKIFSTMEAFADALAKNGGVVEGIYHLSEEQLQSQLLILKSEAQNIRFIQRSCKVEDRHMKCEVIIETSPQKLRQPRSIVDYPDQCRNRDGIQYCYQIQESSKTVHGQYHQQKDSVTVLILWQEGKLKRELFTRTINVQGLGTSTFEAGLSAQQQIKTKAQGWDKWRLYQENFRVIRLNSQALSEKRRLYLTLLGGEVMCDKEICYLLLPKFVY